MCCYVLFIEFFSFRGISYGEWWTCRRKQTQQTKKDCKGLGILKTGYNSGWFEGIFFLWWVFFLGFVRQFSHQLWEISLPSGEHGRWNFLLRKAEICVHQLFHPNWLASKAKPAHNHLIMQKCVLKAFINFNLMPKDVWAIIKWMCVRRKVKHTQDSELFIYLWIVQTGTLSDRATAQTQTKFFEGRKGNMKSRFWCFLKVQNCVNCWFENWTCLKANI